MAQLRNMVRGMGISIAKAKELWASFAKDECGLTCPFPDPLPTEETAEYTKARDAVRAFEGNAVGRICFVQYCISKIDDFSPSDQVSAAADSKYRDQVDKLAFMELAAVVKSGSLTHTMRLDIYKKVFERVARLSTGGESVIRTVALPMVKKLVEVRTLVDWKVPVLTFDQDSADAYAKECDHIIASVHEYKRIMLRLKQKTGGEGADRAAGVFNNRVTAAGVTAFEISKVLGGEVDPTKLGLSFDGLNEQDKLVLQVVAGWLILMKFDDATVLAPWRRTGVFFDINKIPRQANGDIMLDGVTPAYMREFIQTYFSDSILALYDGALTTKQLSSKELELLQSVEVWFTTTEPFVSNVSRFKFLRSMCLVTRGSAEDAILKNSGAFAAKRSILSHMVVTLDENVAALKRIIANVEPTEAKTTFEKDKGEMYKEQVLDELKEANRFIDDEEQAQSSESGGHGDAAAVRDSGASKPVNAAGLEKKRPSPSVERSRPVDDETTRAWAAVLADADVHALIDQNDRAELKDYSASNATRLFALLGQKAEEKPLSEKIRLNRRINELEVGFKGATKSKRPKVAAFIGAPGASTLSPQDLHNRLLFTLNAVLSNVPFDTTAMRGALDSKPVSPENTSAMIRQLIKFDSRVGEKVAKNAVALESALELWVADDAEDKAKAAAYKSILKALNPIWTKEAMARDAAPEVKDASDDEVAAHEEPPSDDEDEADAVGGSNVANVIDTTVAAHLKVNTDPTTFLNVDQLEALARNDRTKTKREVLQAALVVRHGKLVYVDLPDPYWWYGRIHQPKMPLTQRCEGHITGYDPQQHRFRIQMNAPYAGCSPVGPSVFEFDIRERQVVEVGKAKLALSESLSGRTEDDCDWDPAHVRCDAYLQWVKVALVSPAVALVQCSSEFKRAAPELSGVDKYAFDQIETDNLSEEDRKSLDDLMGGFHNYEIDMTQHLREHYVAVLKPAATSFMDILHHESVQFMLSEGYIPRVDADVFYFEPTRDAKHVKAVRPSSMDTLPPTMQRLLMTVPDAIPEPVAAVPSNSRPKRAASKHMCTDMSHLHQIMRQLRDGASSFATAVGDEKIAAYMRTSTNIKDIRDVLHDYRIQNIQRAMSDAMHFIGVNPDDATDFVPDKAVENRYALDREQGSDAEGDEWDDADDSSSDSDHSADIVGTKRKRHATSIGPYAKKRMERAKWWSDRVSNGSMMTATDMMAALTWITGVLETWYPMNGPGQCGPSIVDKQGAHYLMADAVQCEHYMAAAQTIEDALFDFADVYLRYANLMECIHSNETSAAWDVATVAIKGMDAEPAWEAMPLRDAMTKMAGILLDSLNQISGIGHVLHRVEDRHDDYQNNTRSGDGITNGQPRPKSGGSWWKSYKSIKCRGSRVRVRRTPGKRPVVEEEQEVLPQQAGGQGMVTSDFPMQQSLNPLYPHQKANLIRFQRQLALKEGLIIADVPGTGKTASAIACACSMAPSVSSPRKFTVLIVCPKNNMSDPWARDIREWTSYKDDTNVYMYNRSYGSKTREQDVRELGRSLHTFYVISYQLLQMMQVDEFNAFQNHSFTCIIFDEAHTNGMLNRDSSTRKRVDDLMSSNFLLAHGDDGHRGQFGTVVLTGTPLVNSAKDLASLCRVIDPQDAYGFKRERHYTGDDWWTSRKYDTQAAPPVIRVAKANGEVEEIHDKVGFITRTSMKKMVELNPDAMKEVYVFVEDIMVSPPQAARFKQLLVDNYDGIMAMVHARRVHTGIDILRNLQLATCVVVLSAMKHEARAFFENYRNRQLEDGAIFTPQMLARITTSGNTHAAGDLEEPEFELDGQGRKVKNAMLKAFRDVRKLAARDEMATPAGMANNAKFKRIIEIAELMRKDEYNIGVVDAWENKAAVRQPQAAEKTERKVIIFSDSDLVLKSLQKLFERQFPGKKVPDIFDGDTSTEEEDYPREGQVRTVR